MDHPPYSILRPATDFSDHIYSLGYCGTANSCPSRWFNVSTLWEKVVRSESYTVDIPLTFQVYRTLRRGKHRLLLWPSQEADGSMESVTPSKLGARDEMGRLEKVSDDCCVAG